MIDVVYAEKDALDLPFTKKAISKLKKAAVIPIDRWEDVFYRKKQDFAIQKKNQKLIIGINRTGFVMKGSDNCESAGADAFYYCSYAKNCIFGCDYCYLAGMMRCGHLLAFANMEDCFLEVKKLIGRENVSEDKKMLLAVSYDNDVYALEGLFGYVASWSEFAASIKTKGLTIEIRTKCGTKSFIDAADPGSGSLLFTWSVSGPQNVKRFEPLASPLQARLSAAKYAAEKGFRVRLALDPAIALGTGWRDDYEKLCAEIKEHGLGDRLDAVTLGGFRIPADYLKIMRKNAPRSATALDCCEVIGKTACYSPEKEAAVTEFIRDALVGRAGVPEEKIYILNRETDSK